MKGTARQFVAGALALIALFLVLAHSGGFARAVNASASGGAVLFKTLQGR